MCHPLGDYRIAAGSRIYSLGLLNANLVRVLYLDKIGQRQNEYRGRECPLQPFRLPLQLLFGSCPE